MRGQKVMLDMDLALLYGVDTKQLKRQDKSEDNIQMIIEAINQLFERPEPFEVKNIGFISQ